MELKLIGKKDQKTDIIVVSDELFNRDYNEALVHQVITSYLSNARGATRAQKGRSDVAKSTRKPWRQKGTGRARVGMASSPIWRGGGKVFPSSPDENFRKKLNRKMYRAGVSVIVSQLIRDNRLLVTDTFNIDTYKTKALSEKLKALELDEVMVITHEIDDNLLLSSRNIPRVAIVEVKNVDPVSLLRFEKILITTEGLKKFEEILS
ncbi:MAG: 50S ribosomal protein L4 [Nitrosomonas sp.]|jgi:large subunit ribosomal protein L4|uniref:50S ribosomal protein L4 n=1 Tax=Nitrosomonas sp. TaxID=42353 RepID=UPI002720335F|nr:50S ribosomal protein L4 [Nitrosomonas sp.]MDO8894127.1 50S ribosomal protein L4 [Nitrosomonas sp.]MDO9469730.1 50S ribosomal protein L4 [Nitrosomonas sp.]MDP1551012.1 50S ribosomal protein L4 [Nitrosomonas sp.]MDP1787307.1 50S ribosomal protein L4 [Nitrosomonas sp.]MDP1934412.1 50S ribosomal protein L4 [Nitrosomonas sp.]